MKLCAVVAEFNPFHNGHEYLMKNIRENIKDSCIIAIMSGNFVQRGEPAITDKWSRCNMALASGVDLVLELPFVFACNYAKEFATGAVRIIDRLNCIDYIAFGTEQRDFDTLVNIAKVTAKETKEFQELLDFELKKGQSYSQAYINAIGAVTGKAENLFAQSNNILALEYLRELTRLESSVIPYFVERENSGENDINEKMGFAGATKLREMLDESLETKELKPYMPKEAYEILKHSVIFNMEEYFNIIRNKILVSDLGELKEIYGMKEGLENRFYKTVFHARNVQEMVGLINTKRYSVASIKRALISILTGLKKSDYETIMCSNKLVTRVLGFNDKGKQALSLIKIKKSDELDVITNPNSHKFDDSIKKKILAMDVKAQSIYWAAKDVSLYEESDLVRKPIIIK